MKKQRRLLSLLFGGMAVVAMTAGVAVLGACGDGPASYTVSFNSNGGTTVKSQVVEEGKTATLPAAPTLEGYEFVGWFYNGEEYDFSTVIEGNITISAVWQPEEVTPPAPAVEYTVTFDTAGGSYIAAQTIAEGGKAIKPTDPVRNGYVFKGWNYNNAAYDFNAVVTGNITIYAVWEAEEVTPPAPAVEYTVTFDTAGGSYIPAQTISEGGKAAKPVDPVLNGYAFEGWYYNNAAYNFDAVVTGNITISAKWTKLHTVTFDTAGGSIIEALTVKDGQTVQLPAQPERDGYKFLGWYLGDTQYDENSAVYSDIKLTAKWAAVYTVTFDSNGGSAVNEQVVEAGKSATQPTAPVKDGWLFDGWYLINGTKYDFGSSVNNDFTLVAKWVEMSGMLRSVSIDTQNVKKDYKVGEAFTSDGLTITATILDAVTQTGKEVAIELTDKNVTIDSAEFNPAAAGTYEIYVGYTYGGITRWANYQVTVTSVISGVHGIELSKTKAEYNVALDGEQPVAIDINDLTVNAVNDDGTLGEAITEGITYKYFLGAEEITAAEMTTANVRDYQIWAYVTYTDEGGETYVMSDFVLVNVVGDEIYEMSFASGSTTQEQGYADNMSSKWTLSATFSLTGQKTIDLSQCTIGTAAGQYTVSGVMPAVVGGGTAIVTYYYQLGSEVVSYSCEVPYSITNAATAATFGAIIDINAGTADQAELPAATDTITAVANGDEMVDYMVYSNGMSGVNSENKGGANGEGKLYGRVQFGTTKGVTLYLAGPATITLYARYGSSSGEGASFVLSTIAGEIVDTSDVVSNSKAYQIVSVQANRAGVYTIFSNTGSLNTFRIEISGSVIPAQHTFDANAIQAADVNASGYTEEKVLDDVFTIVAASGSTVKVEDISAAPATVGNVTFTKNVNLGGSKKGSGNARSVKFTVTEEMVANGPVYLTVYANHGGGAGTVRTLGAYLDGMSGSGYEYSVPVDGSGAVETMVIQKAGTYYLGSSSSGIVLFKLVLGYTASAQTGQEV